MCPQLDAGVKYLTHSSAVDPCVRSSVHNSYIQQLFQKLKVMMRAREGFTCGCVQCCSAEGDWAQLRETLQMEAHQFLHSADSGHRIDQLIAVLSVLASLYLYSLTAGSSLPPLPPSLPFISMSRSASCWRLRYPRYCQRPLV